MRTRWLEPFPWLLVRHPETAAALSTCVEATWLAVARDEGDPAGEAELEERADELDRVDLRAASSAVVAIVEAELEARVGERLTGSELRELWFARRHAELALSRFYESPGVGAALLRDARLRADGSRRLAMCFGTGDGCGLVFQPPALGRWPRYCPECRRRGTARERAAEARTAAVRRGVDENVQLGNGATGNVGHCSACSQAFVITRRSQRRCQRCRERHARRAGS